MLLVTEAFYKLNVEQNSAEIVVLGPNIRSCLFPVLQELSHFALLLFNLVTSLYVFYFIPFLLLGLQIPLTVATFCDLPFTSAQKALSCWPGFHWDNFFLV